MTITKFPVSFGRFTGLVEPAISCNRRERGEPRWNGCPFEWDRLLRSRRESRVAWAALIQHGELAPIDLARVVVEHDGQAACPPGYLDTITTRLTKMTTAHRELMATEMAMPSIADAVVAIAS